MTQADVPLLAQQLVGMSMVDAISHIYKHHLHVLLVVGKDPLIVRETNLNRITVNLNGQDKIASVEVG